MQRGSSELVRAVASEKYVKPAIREGKVRFSVAVKDVIQDLAAEGFPTGNTPQVCSALRKKAFLRSHGIEIEGIDGPPSKTSTTVVYRYRLVDSRGLERSTDISRGELESRQAPEDADAWAFRVTEKVRGLLREEIAQFGGTDAFIRWVRSEDEDGE
ncbi:MAG: hypothetical protein WBP85_04885 [Terracidiphilus sp.]